MPVKSSIVIIFKYLVVGIILYFKPDYSDVVLLILLATTIKMGNI